MNKTIIIGIIIGLILVAGFVVIKSISSKDILSDIKTDNTNSNTLQDLHQLDLKINGLSCAGCAYGVQYSLKQMNGVVDAEVDYSKSIGKVIYDINKITKEEIVNSEEAFSAYPAEIINDKQITDLVAKENTDTISEIIDDDVHEFNMLAFQWGFEPSTISVHKNGRVVLYLTSKDVIHGFAIPEYDIVAKIEPGKTTTLSFIADKGGEFTFYCSIPCGEGHGQMNGKLIVS